MIGIASGLGAFGNVDRHERLGTTALALRASPRPGSSSTRPRAEATGLDPSCVSGDSLRGSTRGQSSTRRRGLCRAGSARLRLGGRRPRTKWAAAAVGRPPARMNSNCRASLSGTHRRAPIDGNVHENRSSSMSFR